MEFAATLLGCHDEPEQMDSELSVENYFFRAVGRISLLSAEEEVELARRIERGDQQARDTMITANLRLVIFGARRYQGHGLPILDLIQEGAIGLTTAVAKFDWRRGYRFSTYAMWWIQQACQYAIYDQSRVIRLPAHVLHRRRQLQRINDDLEASLQRPATIDELLQFTDLEERQVREALAAAEVDLSLSRPLGEGDEMVIDMIEGEEPDFLANVIGENSRSALSRLLRALPEREQAVVKHRYGLSGRRKMIQRELGDALGISRDAVALIERRALQRLRRTVSRDAWLREEAAAR